MDETLKADVERCASERGIAASEFCKQATLRYMDWWEAQKKRENRGEQEGEGRAV